MSKSLETLQATLPVDVQSSILGSVLEEVYVFVIENGKADDLKSFLETSGFKNILSKTQNGLTTVTAQKEQVFPEEVVLDENVTPDYVTCNTSQVPNNKDCGTISDPDTCNTSYQGGSCYNGCTGNSAQINCIWNDNGTCSDGGGACTEDTCNCPPRLLIINKYTSQYYYQLIFGNNINTYKISNDSIKVYIHEQYY